MTDKITDIPLAPISADSLKESILQVLEDQKAEDVVIVDLHGKSTIADYMIVASGRSTRQVGAIAERVAQVLKKSGIKDVPVEGTDDCNWVLVDAMDVIVHLFRPEVREFYRLEQMWQIDVPKPAMEAAD